MYAMYMYVAVAFAVCVCAVQGYEYSSVCPRISPVNVDLNKYKGTWYNLMHTQPDSFTCSKNTYNFSEHSGEKLLTIDFRYRLHNGTILEQQSGLFRITPSIAGNYKDDTDQGVSIGNMYVLAIDYDLFAVEYLCADVNGAPYEIVIFSTRSGTLDDDLKNRMLKVLTDNHILSVPVDEQQGCAGL